MSTEPTAASELLRWVREVGLPGAIAIYVLVRLDGRLREVARALEDLRLWLAASRPSQPPPPGARPE